MIGSVLLGATAFTGFVTVLAVAAVTEAAAVCRRQGVAVSTPVVLVAGLMMLFGARWAGTGGQLAGVAVLFGGAVVWELTDDRRQQVFRRIAATLLLGLWVPFLASYGVLLMRHPADGWVAVLGAIGVAAVSDVGAYAVGSRYGRHALAPRLSPAKSWEGMAGGVVVAVGLAVVILPLLGSAGLFDPGGAALFAVIVAIAATAGDLTESMLKRDLAVKDLGRLVPGHGGILDRTDGILFALPTGYYTLALVT